MTEVAYSIPTPEMSRAVMPLVDACVKASTEEHRHTQLARESRGLLPKKVVFTSELDSLNASDIYFGNMAAASAKRRECMVLGNRVARVFSMMDQLPLEVAESPTIVNDPYKAEYMAREMGFLMFQAVGTKPGLRRRNLVKKANQVSDMAAGEYDRDPLSPTPGERKFTLSQRLADFVLGT